MRIKVNKTTDGSPNGVEVITYEAGGTYTFPRGLGMVFVREGWGQEVQDEPGPNVDKMIRPTGRRKRGGKTK